MNSLENEVLCFFKKKCTNKKLTKDSYVTDYYKNEDDAFYLFLEFFEVFKIEKGYLDLDKYFYSKPKFWDLIQFKKVKQENKPKISIEHLMRVAEKKEWFDPT